MSQELETELQALSSKLEDRTSMVHFAWAFGLACAAFMSTGVGIKLFHDSVRTPKIAIVLVAFGLGCTFVGLRRLLKGLTLYRTELTDFARFKAVRQQLGLDRPQLPSA